MMIIPLEINHQTDQAYNMNFTKIVNYLKALIVVPFFARFRLKLTLFLIN